MSKKSQIKKVTEKSEEKAPEVVVIGFEDFLQNKKIHPGLVASFKFEASKEVDGLKPRTENEWLNALDAQSNRTY